MKGFAGQICVVRHTNGPLNTH